MTRLADLDPFIRSYSENAYPAAEVRFAACACGGDVFAIELAGEDAARRTCAACGKRHFVCDSEEYWEDNIADNDGEIDEAQCPCKNETFNLAVGFAFCADSRDVRWLYLALRCARCGEIGVYTDWKIDYAPSIQLLDQV